MNRYLNSNFRNRHSLRNHSLRNFREARDITLYAGVDHFDYEIPIFSTRKRDVENCDHTTKITAPRGTYVIFGWDDEHCYFMEAPSPKEAIARWTREFEKQEDDGEDYYFEEEISGGYELPKKDYRSPAEAAQDLYDLMISQEPDGDSNMGILWEKIEKFVED